MYRFTNRKVWHYDNRMSSHVQRASASATKAGVLSWISLITVWFVWGSTFLGIRVAVQSIPPFLMAGTRYVVAGTLLAAIVWFMQGRARPKITREELLAAIVTAFLLLVCGNGLLSFSEIRLESGTAALLVATTPVWMILIDAFFSRKLRRTALAGIILGTLGVVALVGAPSMHGSLGSAVLVLVGSFAWAVGSVYARRHSAQHLNPILPALEMLAGGIMLCIVGIAAGEVHNAHFTQLPAAAVGGWLWLVIAGAMIAYSAYAYAVRTLPTNIVATYAYVNPVVAVILGALLLKESLSWNVLAGGGAIVLSVIAIMLGNRETAMKREPAEEIAA
jgi:drug/metabolite transporter (DMT)-like permease